MSTTLAIYNKVMNNLGERPLASLSETREPKRKVDAIFDDAVPYCLEQGLWNFAMRTVSIDPSATITPTFGYDNAFGKPTDWIRTAVLSGDPTLDPPLLEYSDESGYWYGNVDPLYAQYVSSDDDYGNDLGLWPESFAEYVGLHIARRICLGISASESRFALLEKLEKRMLNSARSKDAMNQAAGFPPTGTWVSSRMGSLSFPARNNRR